MKSALVGVLFLSLSSLNGMSIIRSISLISKQCMFKKAARSISYKFSRKKENNYNPIVSEVVLHRYEKKMIDLLKEIQQVDHESQMRKIACRYEMDIPNSKRFMEWYKEAENLEFNLKRAVWILKREENMKRTPREQIDYFLGTSKIIEYQENVSAGLKSLLLNPEFAQTVITGFLHENRFLEIKLSEKTKRTKEAPKPEYALPNFSIACESFV